MKLDVTDQEFNHILAALRNLDVSALQGTWLGGIATDGGTDIMTEDELDDLCMRLNTEPDPEPEPVRIVPILPASYANQSDTGGKVTIALEMQGPDIQVEDRGVKWNFHVDLFYLSEDGYPPTSIETMKPIEKRCVQIVCFHPDTPDEPDASFGDPSQTVRVYEDGTVETFTC